MGIGTTGGVQTIGARAIIDTSSLAASVAQYQSALNSMVRATQQSSGGLTQTNPFANAASQAGKAGREAGTAFNAGLGAAIGTAAINALSGIMSEMSRLGGAIADNVTFWERLNLSVQFFESRALRLKDETLSQADAFKQSAQEAQKTVVWLQQLAIFSPFTAQDVGRIFRTAQGLGLTADAAKTLIPLLVDFGSVSGATNIQLDDMARAIGQIQSSGKLRGDEIRQLANAGVPIRDILGRALGIAQRDFDKLLESGSIYADKVLPEIVKWLQVYEGAAKKVSTETFGGIVSAMKDIVQLGSAKFGKSFLVPLQEQLVELLDTLSNPQFFALLEQIGATFGQFMSGIITQVQSTVRTFSAAWDAITPQSKSMIFTFGALIAIFFTAVGVFGLVTVAMGALITPLTLTAVAFAYFGTVIGKSLSDAAKWGGSFAEIFIQSMSDVASSISDVARMMAGLFSYWFQPHSPPKFLPDIAKWGQATSQLYLDSWGSADFSAVTDVSSGIRDVLTANAAVGDPTGQLQVIQQMKEVRSAVSQAVDEINRFGNATGSTLNRVAQLAGSSGGIFVEYLKNFAAVARENRAVAAAQEYVNSLTKQYEKILAPLSARLREIKNLQSNADEDKEIVKLRRIISSQYASESARRSAALKLEEIGINRQVRATEDQRDTELGAANVTLTAAQEAQAAAQLRLDNIKQQIAYQSETARLAVEESNAMKSVKEAADKVLSPLERQLKMVQLQQAELSDMVASYRAMAVLNDDNATKAEKSAAQLTLNEIKLRQQQRDIQAADLGFDLQNIRQIPIVLADIEKANKGDPLGGVTAGIENANKSKIEQSYVDALKAVEDMKVAWDNMKKSIQGTFDVVNEMLPSWLKLYDPMGNGGKGSYPVVDQLGKILGLVVAIKLAVETWAILKTIGGIAKAIAGVTSAVGGTAATISLYTVAIGLLFGAIYLNIGGMGDKTKEWLDKTAAAIGDFFGPISASISAWWDDMKTSTDLNVKSITKAWDDLQALSFGIWLAIVQWVVDKVVWLSENILRIYTGIKEWVVTTTQKLSDNLDETWNNITDSIGEALDRFDRWIRRVWDNVVTWVEDSTDSVNTAIQGMIDWFTTSADAVDTWATDLIAGMSTWVDDTNKAIEKWMTDVGAWWDTNVITRAKEMGTNFVKGMVDGMTEGWTFLKDGATGLTGAFLNFMRELLGIGSPSKVANEQIGIPLMMGIAQGILRGQSLVDSALKTALGGLNGGLEVPISMAANQLAPRANSTASSAANGVTIIRNYNLTVQSGKASSNVSKDFALMQMVMP